MAGAPFSVAPLTGIVVITGATNGLGLHCLRALARAGACSHIVLACRDVAAARAVADAAACEATPRERLVVPDAPCDLASLASTRAFAAALRQWLGDRPIAALVNNAGIGGSSPRVMTADGFERIFETNHLGHFLLTLLLLPRIGPSGRIINVSSNVHNSGELKLPLPDPGTHYPTSAAEYESRFAQGDPVAGESESASGSRRYARSKLANIFFANELARRLSGAAPYGCSPEVAAAQAALPGGASCTLPAAKSIAVIAMTPGLMLDSNFASGIVGPVIGTIAWALSPLLRLTPMGKSMRSVEDSGPSLARLAVPELPGRIAIDARLSAAYFDGEALVPASAFSLSLASVTMHQIDLWTHSLRWAMVTAEELAAAGL